MTSKSRNKGSRVEREIVHALNEAGIFAKRVPLSGAMEHYKGDIEIGPFKAEVKARKNGTGFKVLEGWMGDNDFLVLKRNNRQPMIVMDLETFLNIYPKDVKDN